MRYENAKGTELRSMLALRSTVRGANNRLEVEALFSWDDASRLAQSLLPGAEPGAGGADVNIEAAGLQDVHVSSMQLRKTYNFILTFNLETSFCVTSRRPRRGRRGGGARAADASAGPQPVCVCALCPGTDNPAQPAGHPDGLLYSGLTQL